MQSFFQKKSIEDKQEVVEEALLENYDTYYRLAYSYEKIRRMQVILCKKVPIRQFGNVSP